MADTVKVQIPFVARKRSSTSRRALRKLCRSKAKVRKHFDISTLNGARIRANPEKMAIIYGRHIRRPGGPSPAKAIAHSSETLTRQRSLQCGHLLGLRRPQWRPAVSHSPFTEYLRLSVTPTVSSAPPWLSASLTPH